MSPRLILPIFLALILTACSTPSAEKNPIASPAGTPQPQPVTATSQPRETGATATAATSRLITPTATPPFSILSLNPAQTPPESPFMRIVMYDKNMGWAVSSDHLAEPCRLLHTQNGGLTWQDTTPSNSHIFDYTIYFLDAQHAWVISNTNKRSAPQAIYQTSDGGENWNWYQDLPFKFW